MTFLADTSWIVEHLRGNQEITAKLIGLGDQGVAISVLSVAELYVGVYRSNDPQAILREINDFIGTVTVLDIDNDVCLRFGREKAALIGRGQNIGDVDVLIAATALHHNLTLLTSDRDFQRFDGLQTIFL